MGLFLALFLAVTVKDDQAPLRAGCAADSTVVATLPAGTAVTLRYSMAGESVPCYKVGVEVNGKHVDGYLPASAMEGLNSFEQGRRDASWVSTPVTPRVSGADALSATRSSSPLAADAAAAAAPDRATRILIAQAAALIEGNQPAKALALLEPEAQKHRDPSLLVIAGVAAWRADDGRRALEYWRASLELAPNAGVEKLYKQLEREQSNDQSAEKLYGVRVTLRFDPKAVAPEAARQMVAQVDRTFAQVSAQLGCNADEKITAIVQSRDDYRKATDAAEWNGGQYDGRIRVPAMNGQAMDASMQRVLAHETTHACLTMLGDWPAWLQEGLAQRLSGDALAPAVRAKLTAMAAEGKLPRLENLRQDWSRLDSEHATLAYALALAAAELLYESYGNDGVRNLMRNPERLPAISASLDKQLGL
jgi:hypothetical protein